MLNTVIWRYVFLLLPTLFNARVCALKTSSLHFDITDNAGCLATVNVLRRIVSVPLGECVEECAASIGRCKAVNYRRRLKLCELLYEDVGEMVENNSKTGPCVFVKLTSILSNYDAVCRCGALETCDIETRTCSIKECPRMTLANGTVIGNMYVAGSTLEFHCSEGFVEINNRSSSTCMNSGNWSYEPECIVDCGPPSLPKHSLILAGSTTVYSVRTYTCITGYGTYPEGVVMETTCGINGQWSPVNFTCVVDCGPPQQLNHSTISLGSTLAGSTRTYNCTSGFSPSTEDAAMETICGITGHWSSVSLTCVVDCGTPLQLNKTEISQGSTLVGSLRTYACSNGFTPIPAEAVMEIVCDTTGQWSPISFTCTIDCGPPSLPTFSVISAGTTTVDSVRTYTCFTGYGTYPEGVVAETTCGINGQWSPVSFTCVVDCGPPQQLNHSTISLGSTLAGSARTYNCTSGFSPSPEGAAMETICGITGHWSSVSLTCVVDCGTPLQLNKTEISQGSTLVGSLRTYACSNGFTPIPAEAVMEIVCDTTGQWSPVSFTCTIDCGPPSLPTFSLISAGSTTVYSVRTYTCFTGYGTYPEGVVTETTCGINGQWSPVSFTCVVDCGPPQQLNHSTISLGSTLAGSARTYNCTSGFSPSSEGAAMETICGITGHWSSVSLTCVVDCGTPPQVNNTEISSGSTLVGSLRAYTCTSGLTPIPEGSVMETVCDITGQWSPVSFTCTVDCGTPPVVINANIYSGATVIGSTRKYDCLSGFEVRPTNDTMEIQCKSTGKWSSISFACMPPTIGSHCYTKTDCRENGAECISSMCMCGALYQYNSSIKDCVQVCDVLTDSFNYVEDKYIIGYNHLGYYISPSLEDCVATCKANADCLSVDYFSSGECFMSTVTYDMILDAHSSTISVSYSTTIASRQCGWS